MQNNSPYYDMKRIANNILFIANVLFLCFNAYFLCHCYPRLPKNLSFDYMGIIVGLLSLLVGFLVAWQIYKTIEVDKKMEVINNSSRDAIADDMFYKGCDRISETDFYWTFLRNVQYCIAALNMNFSEDKAEMFYFVFRMKENLYYGRGKETVDKVREELDKLKFKSKSINKCYKHLDYIIENRKYATKS